MDRLLNHFQLARFQFILKPIDPIHLPLYKGSTLRGGFGHAFKKVVCVKREKVCETCLLKGKCVYSYVFETPPPPDSQKMKKYPYAPHPFIITPPLEEKRIYHQGDTLCFELTLIGKSIEFLPYFIYTFDELGKIGIGRGKGKYRLEEVRAIHLGQRADRRGGKAKVENGEMIYSEKDKTLRNQFPILKTMDLIPLPGHPSPFTLHLLFVTPTRLKFEGNLTPTLEFHILIRNLLRRISLLSYFHCGEELELDFKGIIESSKGINVKEESLRWLDWERYSNRQETKMKMGGFIGTIVFEGDLETFMPFLRLGEYLHVGKGTSFGLGKYNILEVESPF